MREKKGREELTRTSGLVYDLPEKKSVISTVPSTTNIRSVSQQQTETNNISVSQQQTDTNNISVSQQQTDTNDISVFQQQAETNDISVFQQQAETSDISALSRRQQHLAEVDEGLAFCGWTSRSWVVAYSGPFPWLHTLKSGRRAMHARKEGEREAYSTKRSGIWPARRYRPGCSLDLKRLRCRVSSTNALGSPEATVVEESPHDQAVQAQR
ncbi:hypothetical protein BZA70DRAFT_308143 [Myxozyma melibiosi]|uniref:Uncharacterized protein n=1 Tax=Myxozyma melibiosi TaxID=54550 RepID=A0ABR1FBN6_9ASCO